MTRSSKTKFEKLVAERRIARIHISPDMIASWIQGSDYGHSIQGLPEDAILYQTFYSHESASFVFDFVSKYFDVVPEGVNPGTLLVKVVTNYPEHLTVWQKFKRFIGL